MAFETSHTEVEGRFLDDALGVQARVLEVGCGRRTRRAGRRDRIAILVGVDVDEAAGRENEALESATSSRPRTARTRPAVSASRQ
jgi:hypothetical protein